MHRRQFLKQAGFATAGLFAPPVKSKTEHVILIVNSGARKKEYYEDATLSPHVAQLAREGFVFEQDHCERVASHNAAFRELLQGREFDETDRAYPTILDYVRSSVVLSSITNVAPTLNRYRPQIIVCRDRVHDTGHETFEAYLCAVKRTDAAIGGLVDWISNHPHFSRNTAIVIRPDFGRDDVVNENGQLHHSYGFYYTHRVASIFWGPEFNPSVEQRAVINSIDIAPTVARLLNVHMPYAIGRAVL